MQDATRTIYEWAGGHEAFARWLNRFYDLVERDAPDIAALFGGSVSEEHRAHVTAWWAEVMGGPANYTEQRGGYEHMTRDSQPPQGAPVPLVPAALCPPQAPTLRIAHDVVQDQARRRREHGGSEALEAEVEWFVSTLDETVGVERDGRARGERDLGRVSLDIVAQSEQLVGVHVGKEWILVRWSDHGQRVTGDCELHAGTGNRCASSAA